MVRLNKKGMLKGIIPKRDRPQRITGIECFDCKEPEACAFWQGNNICTRCSRIRMKDRGVIFKKGCPKGWRKSFGVRYYEYKDKI